MASAHVGHPAAPPFGDGVAVPHSPTRRRLLALLAGLPFAGAAGVGDGYGRPGAVPGGDPLPYRFAAFRALLDRHAAALADCDRLEGALSVDVGYSRVRLPRGADGTPRFAADPDAVTRAVPPGRRRDRLLRVLRERQRRWDAGALAEGLIAAQQLEASLDDAVLAEADALLAAPAWTLQAAVLKLVVLLGVHDPGPAADGTVPWAALRQLLADLGALVAEAQRGAR